MPYKDPAARRRYEQENRRFWPSRNKTALKAKRKKWDANYIKKNGREYRGGEFIAFDGEGMNLCGHEEPCDAPYMLDGTKHHNHLPDCHSYVLLMNSKGDTISDLDGLGTDECLRYLVGMNEKYPNSICVIYGGSYDVNMILKDLPYDHILRLQRNKRVFWGDEWEIEYVSRKFFKISQYEPGVHIDKRKRKPIRVTQFWDVIGFFQGTFVKSLEEYFTEMNDRKRLHLEQIKEGKARRSNFKLSEEELENFVKPYTTHEVRALVALMNKLRVNMLTAGIRLKRYDGAGAAAAAILDKYKVKRWYDELPLTVEKAAQVAYGGGRVEILMYGHTDEPVYHYDLIGAYPSVMPYLPALLGGTWIHHEHPDLRVLTPYTLYKIYWDYKYRYANDGTRLELDRSNVIYPFFYRQPWHEPRVFYPHQGYTWVWTPELNVALRYKDKLGGKILGFEAWQFVPRFDVKPFAFVNDLYKKRIEFKKAGNGAQLALKLGINSLYGKTAQTKGYNRLRRNKFKKPPFYNLMYAGLITSLTRARMFDAAMQDPEAIIAIATDGIWSTRPLDLDIGDQLGQWEFELLKHMTSVQAGVYYATKEDGSRVEHYRGFNAGSISEEAILNAWDGNEWLLRVPTTRFTTMGTAVASEERFDDLWRVWDNTDRILRIVPGGKQKREISHDISQIYHAAEGLIPLEASYPMYFDDRIRSPRMLTEEFLSSAHPLPWDMYEQTDDERRTDLDREIDREILESEL